MNELSNAIILSNSIRLSGLSNVNESLSSHYLIYKIQNLINDRYYIGQHSTTNLYDNYMGSGKLINQAVEKYGISAFLKIILFDFTSFELMNQKEAELVQISNCFPYDKYSYNLKEGGINGRMSDESKKIHDMHVHETWKKKSKEEIDVFRMKVSKVTSGKNNGMFNYKWTDEQRKHQSDMMKGRSSVSSMTDETYAQWCRSLSDCKKGNKNPMFGKNSEDYMSKEAILAKRRKISEKQKDTKRMQNLSISKQVVNVKLDQVEQYLKLGYTFWKYKKPPISEETRERMRLAAKNRKKQIVSNDSVI